MKRTRLQKWRVNEAPILIDNEAIAVCLGDEDVHTVGNLVTNVIKLFTAVSYDFI
jgi:hypothetical protein